jgi:hypothetical protein
MSKTLRVLVTTTFDAPLNTGAYDEGATMNDVVDVEVRSFSDPINLADFIGNEMMKVSHVTVIVKDGDKVVADKTVKVAP